MNSTHTAAAATALSNAATRIAGQHDVVLSKFTRLRGAALAGTIDEASAASEARQLGVIRANLEADMEQVLLAASAILAQILMPSVKASAAAHEGGVA